MVERAQTQLLNEVNADATANVCAEFCVVEPGKLLYTVGIVLQHIFHNTSSKMYRRVSALDQLVKNSSDMLVSLRSDNAGGVAGKARATGLFDNNDISLHLVTYFSDTTYVSL